MAWLEMPHERRRTLRVRSRGSIEFRRGAQVLRGRVVDLALGGICAHVRLPVAATALIGGLVRVELRLDARPARQLMLHGHVLRVAVEVQTVVIGFDVTASEEFTGGVHSELAAAAKYDSSPHLILVDSVAARRNAMAGAFRNAGCHVTEASTPLEAIAHLDRARFAPGVIAIADTVPESIAEELRGFLRDQHPDAHMVAVGRSSANRDPSQSWLSSNDPRGDLQMRVGRVMVSHSARRQSAMSRSRRQGYVDTVGTVGTI